MFCFVSVVVVVVVVSVVFAWLMFVRGSVICETYIRYLHFFLSYSYFELFNLLMNLLLSVAIFYLRNHEGYNVSNCSVKITNEVNGKFEPGFK